MFGITIKSIFEFILIVLLLVGYLNENKVRHFEDKIGLHGPEAKRRAIMNEYFDYLDDLRESGICNMFGAAPYLAKEFGLPMVKAKEIHLEWMRTFGDRHGEEEEE